jgi:hypothetical protein
VNPEQVRRWRAGALSSVTLLLTVALWLPASSAATAATSTTFSGQATVLSGTLPVIGTITVVDTGPLPSGATEANIERAALCYAAPDTGGCLLDPPVLTGSTLSAVVLHATVIAGGDTSDAEASVANFKLSVAGQEIGADLLHARAQATCTGNGAVVKAGAETSVTINGAKYTVAAGETQTIQLVDAIGVSIGDVVINEGASGPKSGSSIDASALHVVIPGAGVDLTVAKVHADVICGSLMNCPARNSFITGGGYIGNKQHFAVAGRDGDYWGHVLYQPSGLHVKSPYAVVFRTIRDLDTGLSGSKFNFTTSMLDGQPGAFEGAAILTWKDQAGSVLGQALAVDMGEPGNQPKGSDYFELASASGSIAGGFLQGGNIQMHGKC